MEAGQRDDLDLGVAFVQGPCHIRATHARHRHIHKDHIWICVFAALQRFLSSGGLRDQFDIVEGQQKHTEPAANDSVIVDNHHANRIRLGHGSLPALLSNAR